MIGGGWVYLLFTVALAAVFAGIVLHYFDRRRRDRVEAPKFRMLADEDDERGRGTEMPEQPSRR